MPPPGRRAIRPVLREGDLLADRYRLQHAVEPVRRDDPAEESAAILWRAHDEVLNRPVAVKVLRAAGRRGAAAARPFLEAAAAAGALGSPVLARVYDAAIEERPAERAGRPAGEVDVAYVISEWVDGRDLASVLREDGPFEPAVAAALAAQLAEALQIAHARGVWHGRVHPGNVLLTADGRVKLTDLATSRALPERSVPAQRGGDPVGPAVDVRDLTAVLYAMLTARWPASATPQPASGLPAAPVPRDGRERGGIASPRQVVAGVPTALDALVLRVLVPTPARPAPATAAALADALTAAVRTETPRPVVPRKPLVPPGLRRRLPLMASLAFLLLVGVVSYVVGRELGEVPPPDDPLEAVATASPDAPSAEPVDIAPTALDDFDPQGDGEERPGEIANVVDGDPTTVWEAERYASADFGGLKEGVGLLIDLGAPTPVTRIEVATVGSGTEYQLRVADSRGEQVTDYAPVATATSQDELLVLTPPEGTTSRYYLVWITGLSATEGGFSAAIRDLRVLRG